MIQRGLHVLVLTSLFLLLIFVVVVFNFYFFYKTSLKVVATDYTRCSVGALEAHRSLLLGCVFGTDLFIHHN